MWGPQLILKNSLTHLSLSSSFLLLPPSSLQLTFPPTPLPSSPSSPPPPTKSWNFPRKLMRIGGRYFPRKRLGTILSTIHPSLPLSLSLPLGQMHPIFLTTHHRKQYFSSYSLTCVIPSHFIIHLYFSCCSI